MPLISSSPLFIWVCRPHKIIGNVYHTGVFNFENRVATDQCDPSTLGNQDHIIAFKKPDKTCQRNDIWIMSKKLLSICDAQQYHSNSNQVHQFVPFNIQYLISLVLKLQLCPQLLSLNSISQNHEC